MIRIKYMTVFGKRYRLHTRSYDEFVEVRGPRIAGGLTLPAGVTLDSEDLRERVIEELEKYRERSRRASELVQQRVRDGVAGIGWRPEGGGA